MDKGRKKIIIAADSFKGSLSSAQVADAVEKGVWKVYPQYMVQKVIVADGGEGTVEALVSTLGGEFIYTTVHDPLMRPVTARYGIVNEGRKDTPSNGPSEITQKERTAVIEMAAASGLPLLAVNERNPMKTTTFGTGELILDALKRGCRNFLIGIGGSATNDAGVGMLQALGFRFFDDNGAWLGGNQKIPTDNKSNAATGIISGSGGEIMEKIAVIDDSHIVATLSEAKFTIACDVTNPFAGSQGAAYIFAPQKGATAAMVEKLDHGMHHFAETIKRFNGTDVQNIPGAGAAGGLGGAFCAFLHANLVPGINMILDAVGFEEMLNGCDLVITGEGRLDEQTVYGKAPAGILAASRKRQVPVLAIGGSISNEEELLRQGFVAAISIHPNPLPLHEAMKPDIAAQNIEYTIAKTIPLLLS